MLSRDAAASSLRDLTSLSQPDTGVSGSGSSVVTMTDTTARVRTFFDRYAEALLGRDEQAIAAMYAVPSLIVFPGQRIAVSDQQQTADFFGASWAQYEGVTEASPTIAVLADSTASVWADVTWSFGGSTRERFCYQLAFTDEQAQIVVLTPLDLS